MAVLWLTQFTFVTLNILLGVLFVMANSDFCGSVFETQVDHVLLGNVVETAIVMDEFECQLKCMGNNICKSCNVLPGDSNGNRICELNSKTRQMKPGDLKPRKGSTYYGSVQVSCIDVSRERNKQTKSGQCHPGYKGARCQKPSVLNIFIRSECCDDPGKTPNTCGIAYIKVNGKDYSRHLRGHNVVIVSSVTGAILDSKAFDTFGDSSAGNHLRDYLNSMNGSKIVLVAIQDEGSIYISPAIDALKRVGATHDLLNLTDFKVSFALVGYAGVNKPPWIAQQSAKRGKGPSEISLKIPLPTAIRGLYYNQPAHSCKDIRDSGVSQKDGEYWIDPEKNGKPLKVFCDMTTDRGGWLLVSNVVVDNPSSRQFSVESSYRGISNCHNKTFLTKSAMKELRTHLSFTQLRFHCSKKQGRTFHVTTATNSTGEAVVQYFSDQTGVRPFACGSFARMKDDNSKLAGACKQWTDQKWGHLSLNEDRLYNHAAYVSGTYHWLLTPGGSRWECDDINVGVSSGDFWKVFVR